ncbi:MAG: GlsB/YeaQ/YmgE family stress response membrane protein [bacterium]|nr:GlsB/YeaQ/YmgE family stress response membrane protein [bacterium]
MNHSLWNALMLAQTSPLDQPLVVAVVPSQIITIIIVGLIAGFIANLIIRGRSGFIASLTFGILGAVVGNFLFAFLNISVTPELAGGITLRYYDLLASFVGALLLLVLLIALFGRRFR